MNREILFRGKHTDTGEWVEGLLFTVTLDTYSELEKKKYTHCIVEPSVEMYRGEISSFDFVIPETVGQYTGLTDKNGKKIFEGDIVQHENDIGVVSYSDSFAKFRVVYSQLSGNWFDFEGECCYPIALECEVIGNRHDNPELLK